MQDTVKSRIVAVVPCACLLVSSLSTYLNHIYVVYPVCIIKHLMLRARMFAWPL